MLGVRLPFWAILSVDSGRAKIIRGALYPWFCDWMRFTRFVRPEKSKSPRAKYAYVYVYTQVTVRSTLSAKPRACVRGTGFAAEARVA